MSKYLFIGCHTDDIELCCGGTLARMIDYGHECTVLVLSHEYNGVSLMGEFLDSMKGLKPDFITIKDFPSRHFFEYRQQILDLLVTFKDYDFVFTHSCADFHQDHSVVGFESQRAFKHANLITYQGDWNQRNFKKNYFVELFRQNIEKKLEALNCYKSQQNRAYMHPDYIWANALNNGVISGTKYAEAFELINYLD